MKKALKIITGVTLSLLFSHIASADSLQGKVVNEMNRGVPGLTVSLVHLKIGRSSPVITDSSGHFSFPNVPPQPDVYYLEVYWGRDLLYSKPVKIQGNMTYDPIMLRH